MVPCRKADYDDSLYLFKGSRHPNAVYHMCQALEKVLKAVQIEFAHQIPKKTHDLESIAGETQLDFSPEQIRLALRGAATA
jgi:HEPN domain-containing protein